MTMCETVVPILIAQLKALYARECRTHQDLRLHITEALAHFGSQIQALQLQDPLEMQFLEVYGHLAIWRIEQFRNDILQRVTMLNASPLVQRAIQMLPSCLNETSVNVWGASSNAQPMVSGRSSMRCAAIFRPSTSMPTHGCQAQSIFSRMGACPICWNSCTRPSHSERHRYTQSLMRTCKLTRKSLHYCRLRSRTSTLATLLTRARHAWSTPTS